VLLLRFSANEYSCAHGAQINFGDLTPYLAYANDEKDEIYQMMDSSKAVPYRLDEPKPTKPVIESKHQLQGIPGRSSVLSGELQAGGKSICLCLTGVL
jgi:hypothetical protein